MLCVGVTEQIQLEGKPAGKSALCAAGDPIKEERDKRNRENKKGQKVGELVATKGIVTAFNLVIFVWFSISVARIDSTLD